MVLTGTLADVHGLAAVKCPERSARFPRAVRGLSADRSSGSRSATLRRTVRGLEVSAVPVRSSGKVLR